VHGRKPAGEQRRGAEVQHVHRRVRLELHHQGTLVVAVHASFIDTDMAALANVPKDSPESVAQQVIDAVEAGQVEVLADERTRAVKAELSRDHELIYPPIQEFWDAAVKDTP
jgi:NAD(P)-dependent dehydrogenase (short-subunit alcohol dehydrogenase family)